MSHHFHFPKSKKKKEIFLIDSLAYISGVIAPLMALPQLYIVWVDKNVAGVSAFSWGSFAFFNIIFIIYGYVNKEKLILFTNSLWFIIQAAIALGVLLYS